MSNVQSSAAWKIEGLSMAQKLILVKLADNASDAGECFPSIARMARECCCSKATVIRAISDLQSQGLISASKRKGTSNTYALNVIQAVRTSRREQPVAQSNQPQRATSGSVQLVAQSNLASCTEQPPLVAESNQGSCTEQPEPSLNHQENHQEPPKRARSSKSRLEEPDFADDDLPEFIEIMTEWFDYKLERKEGYQPTGWRACLSKHRKFPIRDLRRFIETAMANGWKGVYPPDGYEPPPDPNPRPKPKPDPCDFVSPYEGRPLTDYHEGISDRWGQYPDFDEMAVRWQATKDEHIRLYETPPPQEYLDSLPPINEPPEEGEVIPD